MYKSTKIRLIIALVVALIGAISAYGFLVSSNEKVGIIVAARDIPSRTELTKEDLKQIEVYKDDYVTFFPNAALDIEDLVGAITKEEVKVNTPIEKTPDSLVYDEEKSLALNYKGGVDGAYFIPEDKRVIGVEVDASGAINYKLNRGDFVDVVLTSTDEGKGGFYSTIIAEHIPIFDIDPVVADSSSLEKSQKVLLLATPEECLQITVAKRNGTIDFMLNPLNGETGNNTPVNLKEFSVDEPMTKSEMLEGLESYIDGQEISAGNKDKLLKNIAQERDVETIKQTINASNLSKEEKERLINLLEK